MTLLELRFPAGRYHATPWGRHVNEGAVEWPPSPWRILRALIATRHLKARIDVPEARLAALITSLAAHQPSFQFPSATTGHTRHYMPYIEGSKEKTTKVFDTFLHLPKDDPLTITWDMDLPEDQFRDLQLLAERMGYFGRAESLVLAVAARTADAFKPDAQPVVDGEAPPSGTDPLRLLSPMAEPAYQQWKTGYEAGLAAAVPASPAKGKTAKPPKRPDLPSDVFAALHADTGELQAAGWNVPPGSAWVTYARTTEAFAPQPRPRRVLSATDLPTVARYTIAGKVLPSILDSVSLADRTHKALCAWSDKGSGRGSVFTGLDSEKQPFKDHRHAHVFCEANGTRGEITHLTVWAPMGFDADACLALRQLNKVWGREGHDVRLVLEALGSDKDFADSPLLKPSRHWRSLTPFISTRHAKTTRPGKPKMDATGDWQIGSDGHDLIRLLALDPRTRNATVGVIDHVPPLAAGGRYFRALQFQTIRHGGGGSRGIGSGTAFTVTFPDPVAGPLVFGYGSHFGLGLFVPAD